MLFFSCSIACPLKLLLIFTFTVFAHRAEANPPNQFFLAHNYEPLFSAASQRGIKFPPPSPFSGMGRGIGMRRPGGWAFRGDGSPRGTFRGAPLSAIPPRFIRGRPFARGGSGTQGGPKDRFPPKFLERGRHLRGFRWTPANNLCLVVIRREFI